MIFNGCKKCSFMRVLALLSIIQQRARHRDEPRSMCLDLYRDAIFLDMYRDTTYIVFLAKQTVHGPRVCAGSAAPSFSLVCSENALSDTSSCLCQGFVQRKVLAPSPNVRSRKNTITDWAHHIFFARNMLHRISCLVDEVKCMTSEENSFLFWRKVVWFGQSDSSPCPQFHFELISYPDELKIAPRDKAVTFYFWRQRNAAPGSSEAEQLR